MLQDKLQAIREEAVAAFKAATSSKDLYDQKVKYLGKKGSFSELMKEMGKLSKDERPKFGQLVNEVKNTLEDLFKELTDALKEKELNASLEDERIDMSLPGNRMRLGKKHPINMVIDELVDIFSRIGFSVRLGPLIERDRYNFEALNIPADHPARDMQDTFYIDEQHVLRTQTSPIQIHSLENESLPLRVLGPGAVFRSDYDVSHLPMFHQIEGILVDKEVSMADLKGILAYFAKEFFGPNVKIRLRPSFFPFTEPSAEVDCSCAVCDAKGCRMCGHTGWIEVAGCGLVHPNVFKEAGLDAEKWQGLAFGMGIERLAVVKYGVRDIRLFNENDMDFLGQF
ncbi:MAG: phenylalanine--tRNA ligase subunit alpha [Bdellovibrionaceae bacterium]|nr:phenylalanine--tRNA ligase subunit alpha [Pseudobdellovibrionaceae bacterium]|tara:strand:- start:97553 stop:98572 length:1020 start_codon:yes stop_codon:yes gene_type:complete